MTKKLLATLLVPLLATVLGAGCSKKPAGSAGKLNGEIKIGLMGPMTGPNADYGRKMQRGVGLAVEEINAAGGVLGKELKVVQGDSQAKPQEAISVAESYVQNKEVVAVLGPFTTGEALAAAPVFQKGAVPEMVVAATDPRVPKVGDFIFRINPSNVFQASQIARGVAERFGKKTVGLIHVNNDWGKSLAEKFKEVFTQAGGKVLNVQTYVIGEDIDYSSLLTKALADKPDALVLVSYGPDGGQIVRQARQLGQNVAIFAADGIYTADFLKVAGAAADGVVTGGFFHPTVQATPKTAGFVEKYRQKFGNEDPDAWAAFSYDAAYVLADAIKRATGTDRTAIRDSLARTKDFEGITGITTFVEREPGDKTFHFFEVKDGKFTPIAAR